MNASRFVVNHAVDEVVPRRQARLLVAPDAAHRKFLCMHGTVEDVLLAEPVREPADEGMAQAGADQDHDGAVLARSGGGGVADES